MNDRQTKHPFQRGRRITLLSLKKLTTQSSWRSETIGYMRMVHDLDHSSDIDNEELVAI